MMKVRAIRKFHDDKGILIGYTIQDEATGQQMNVYKEQLKQAVINKQCEIVNMTLTSDGRLIGKAAPAPKKREQVHKGSGINLIEVYTNGRHLVAGLVDKTVFDAEIHEPAKNYNGLAAHQSFDVGHELTDNIKHNYFDNIRIIDGKPDMSAVKRKSFSKVRDKMIKLLKNNGINFTLKVEKSDRKYEYAIIIEGYDKIEGEEPMVQTIYSLIEDAVITAKLKPLYIDEDSVFVQCMTGINDVRKALKDIRL